jgi:hypothetical protein
VITQKAERVAAERRELEAEREQTRQARERYAELLPALEQQLAALSPQQPDFDALYRDDPIEAVRQERAWRQRQDQVALLRAEQRYLADQQQAEQARQREQQVVEEKTKLLKARPEWANADRWRADSSRMAAFASRIGIPAEELGSVVDHRYLIILDRAARYDELVQKSKAKPTAQAAQPERKPPILKAGPSSPSRKSTPVDSAKQRFAKSRSLRDAASLLDQMLTK